MSMSTRSRRVCLAAALAGTASLAQGQAQAPAGVNPLSQLPAPAPVPLAPEPAPQLRLEQPAGPATSKLEQSITPSRFDIEGVDALAFDEVAGRFAALVGRPTTVHELVRLAQEVTSLYKERGYPLSFTYVPDQGFAGGVVRIVAVEGYIASVRIEGEAGAAMPKLREIGRASCRERVSSVV